MPAIQLNKNAKSATVDVRLKDHANDAFVVKKLEVAKTLIQKIGLPKNLK